MRAKPLYLALMWLETEVRVWKKLHWANATGTPCEQSSLASLLPKMMRMLGMDGSNGPTSALMASSAQGIRLMEKQSGRSLFQVTEHPPTVPSGQANLQKNTRGVRHMCSLHVLNGERVTRYRNFYMTTTIEEEDKLGASGGNALPRHMEWLEGQSKARKEWVDKKQREKMESCMQRGGNVGSWEKEKASTTPLLTSGRRSVGSIMVWQYSTALALVRNNVLAAQQAEGCGLDPVGMPPCEVVGVLFGTPFSIIEGRSLVVNARGEESEVRMDPEVVRAHLAKSVAAIQLVDVYEKIATKGVYNAVDGLAPEYTAMCTYEKHGQEQTGQQVNGPSPAQMAGSHEMYLRSVETSEFGIGMERREVSKGTRAEDKPWQVHALGGDADSLAEALERDGRVGAAEDVREVSKDPGIVEVDVRHVRGPWVHEVISMKVGDVEEVVRFYQPQYSFADTKMAINKQEIDGANAVAEVKCLVTGVTEVHMERIIEAAGVEGSVVHTSFGSNRDVKEGCEVIRVGVQKADDVKKLAMAYRSTKVAGCLSKRRVGMTMAGTEVYQLPQVVFNIEADKEECELWDVVDGLVGRPGSVVFVMRKVTDKERKNRVTVFMRDRAAAGSIRSQLGAKVSDQNIDMLGGMPMMGSAIEYGKMQAKTDPVVAGGQIAKEEYSAGKEQKGRGVLGRLKRKRQTAGRPAPVQRMWDAAQEILDKGDRLKRGEVRKEVFFEVTAALEDMDDNVVTVGEAVLDGVVDILQEEGLLDDTLDAESIDVSRLRRMASKVQKLIQAGKVE